MHGEQLGFGSGRLIAKGLNQIERASLLHSKLGRFKRPRVYSLDCSRFDQHVEKELLRVEHEFYLSIIPDERFAELLSWQLENRGRTNGGIMYHTRGKRMSGDMNTALGNCVLMCLLVKCIADRLHFTGDILDDGDDCLLIVEDGTDLTGLSDTFLLYGMEIKLENETTDFQRVAFCQSKPVWDGVGWKFVRDPLKVIGFGVTAIRNVQHPGAQRKLIYTMGQAELALDIGVPVLQEYATMLMRCAGTNQTLDLDDDGLLFRMRRECRTIGPLSKLQPRPITAEARVAFAVSWGIEPWEQVLIEEGFRRQKTFEVYENSCRLNWVKWTLNKCWQLGLTFLKTLRCGTTTTCTPPPEPFHQAFRT
jgi:hypothetical protein